MILKGLTENKILIIVHIYPYGYMYLLIEGVINYGVSYVI